MTRLAYNIYPEIASIIKNHRIMSGYSQEYVAKRIGITQKTYCNYERNIDKVTIDILLQICKCLEIRNESLIRIFGTLINEARGETVESLREENKKLNSLINQQRDLMFELEKML